MARRVIHVRHGESTNNATFRRTGSKEGRVTDPLLSELGHRQADLVADAVAGDPSVHGAPIWVSPTARAVQTGAAVAGRLGSPRLVLTPDLVEGGGVYERVDGARVAAAPRPIESLRAAAPETFLDWDVPESASWTGGFEGFAATPERARRLLARVLACEADAVVLVGHEWFGQHLIRAALDLPDASETSHGWFEIPNASITEIVLGSETATLRRCGDVHHLGDLARPTAAGVDA